MAIDDARRWLLVAPSRGGRELGAAVCAARWELLADHSPVGLTFVAYGNADLRLGAGGST